MVLISIGICLSLYLAVPEHRVQAQEKYPVKPIVAICALEAGSDGDLLWRPLCQKAQESLGQPVIVINKPGAGSTIGYRETYTAKPDGYTVGYGMATLITNKLQGILPYDFEDFTVMGTFYRNPQIIIGSTKTSRPFKTMQEVLSFAKAHPGEVSIATGAVGQSVWVGTMAFLEGTGLKFNVIPQAGAGGFVVAQVAGGHADIGFMNYAAARPHIEAGNIRLLAIFGDKLPLPPGEKVPTLKELGYDVGYENFGFVIGPPKLPKNVTEKLVHAFGKAASDPEYHKFLNDKYVSPMPLPPDQAIKFLNEKRIVLHRLMDKAGILKK